MMFLHVFGFGPAGWGASMLQAAGTTVLVALLGFLTGGAVGAVIAWAALGGGLLIRSLAQVYVTVLRGVPALLVIYLIYFGGSNALGAIGSFVGYTGFIGLPPLPTGVLALAIVSGAYHAEILRGAYRAIPPGQLEAAHSIGMGRLTILRLITLPLVLRYALPGLGNVWQMVLKESALISVVGLIDLMGQSQIGAGSTSQPFLFFAAAGLLYLVISSVSGAAFRGCERWTLRGVRMR